ncbi:KH domain-containing protein [Leptolyngbya sp. Heron Island J]|uniref:KH domain-containing protein n=1 Tax=Leptolyngbya sp. Heron Island J TaxID=1385935 RepID=UPI001F42B99F|nr:KH domain-containing protein [Leptolyngbya sp. Heron Island J]
MPDFEALVKFLVTPFLESPDALRLDFEPLSDGQRLWVRVAFDGEDKGRVFGRGGRNIQAIRKVLKATGSLHNCSVHLDVYGESSHDSNGGASDRGRPRGGRNGGGGRPRRSGGRPPGPSRNPRRN